MHRTRRAFAVALVLLCLAPALQAAAAFGRRPSPSRPRRWTTFLRTAAIKKKARADKGATDTIRATLSDGRITHDAQIQTVDVAKTLFSSGKASETNFKDSWRYNIGGYQLARLLGMNNIPMSVKRTVDGMDAAVTWWIDDVQFDEQGRLKQENRLGPNPDRTIEADRQSSRLRRADSEPRPQPGQSALDQGLDALADRPHAGVPPGPELMKPDQLTRCDRALLQALRGLTFEGMNQAMGEVMSKDEMNAVLFRRDLIVKHFDDRVARLGEAVVLFTM